MRVDHRIPDAIVLAAAFAVGLAHAIDKGAMVESDAQIMAVLLALDENEVHAAATVEEKKVTGNFLALAQLIHQDHSKDIEDVKTLGTTIGIEPKDTPAVAELRAKGKQTLEKLTPLTGGALESAFVSEMVSGHREALQLVDEMLKTARNPNLKEHLASTRQRIALHLQQAESLKT
jgi:predicted outer membrane protein